jgi:cell wall-associated NlpC family hydrolase
MTKNITKFKVIRNVKEVIRAMVGRPYAFGGNGSVPGAPFDCFGMVIEYCRLRYGVDILKVQTTMDYRVDSYVERYNDSREATLEEYHNFLKDTLSRVAIGYLFAGDVVWSYADAVESVGIYCGLQKMLIAAPETNCVVISSEFYKIQEAYRCPLQYQ